MKQNNFKVIGLTGGIASGKTTVSNYLIKKGFNVIDADKIAREIVQKDSLALTIIKKTFGDGIINHKGELNRKKLRSIVFNDENELSKLNNIMHPIIISKIKEAIHGYRNRNELVFLDCPLLFEMGLEELTDEIWLVSTSLKNQVKRIIKRDNVTKDAAIKIIKSQLPLEVKISKSDYIIENNATLKVLLEEVDKITKKRC